MYWERVLRGDVERGCLTKSWWYEGVKKCVEWASSAVPNAAIFITRIQSTFRKLLKGSFQLNRGVVGSA